jgi:hypothetical protein
VVVIVIVMIVVGVAARVRAACVSDNCAHGFVL